MRQEGEIKIGLLLSQKKSHVGFLNSNCLQAHARQKEWILCETVTFLKSSFWQRRRGECCSPFFLALSIRFVGFLGENSIFDSF
uniref:Uncharacterized protein n=1 Tax=Salix viminalis TaxID=40686 RepID=A0A6N2LNG3_SALVM